METEPLSERQLLELERNDPGVKLLIEILTAGHPLYARLVPAGECGPTDEGDSGTQPQVVVAGDPHSPNFKATDLYAVGRRTSQAISGWIDHYAAVAASQLEVQKDIASFLSKSKLMPELEKVNIPLEDFLVGKAPEGYEFLRIGVLEIDEKIKLKDALKYDGGKIETEPGKSAIVDLYTPDGKHFASTTLHRFKEGRGYSSRYWSRLRHGTKTWFKHTVEVWMAKTVKGAPAFAKSMVDSGIWTKTILPAVVLFEGWNLQNVVRTFMKSEGIVNRQLVDLGSALADSAVIAASINQARFDIAHRKAERLVGETIDHSMQHIRAIRWARGIGAGAGVLSAGLSIYDMIRNAKEGDDAAIAHGVMASGFLVVTISEVAGLFAAGVQQLGSWAF